MKYISQVETKYVTRLLNLAKLSAEAATISEVINYDTRAHEIAIMYAWMNDDVTLDDILKGYNIRRDAIKNGDEEAIFGAAWKVFYCQPQDGEDKNDIQFGEDGYEAHFLYALAKDNANGSSLCYHCKITGPGGYIEIIPAEKEEEE